MSLEEKVREVEGVFQALDSRVTAFQSASGLQCKFGCGKCCFKPDIDATVLEFLPLAYHLYKEGKAEQWHESLRGRAAGDGTEQNESVCVVLDPNRLGAGLCSDYVHRGLICRLFGYSARVNKYGEKELVTCRIIKTEQQVQYVNAMTAIGKHLDVPVMNEFYMQLHAIDPELSRDFFPINIAIMRAIETVLHYFAYRDA